MPQSYVSGKLAPVDADTEHAMRPEDLVDLSSKGSTPVTSTA
jgi:hypothetical protein